MKKGDILTGIIDKVVFPNKGIINTYDKPIHIKDVLLGQNIEFKITKNRSEYAKGEVIQILDKSKYETEENLCKNFGVCGGCYYQRVIYEEQLKLKENQIKELLSDYVTEDIFDTIIKSPKNIEYRNKMELSFGDEIKDGELTLGLHKKKSKYDILDVEDCVLMDNDFRTIRNITVEYFRKKGTSYYHKLTHKGYLRHLLLRRGENTGEILVAIVTSSQENIDFSEWINKLLEEKYDGKIVGILHIVNDAKADAVINQGLNTLYGRDYYMEKLLDLDFKVSVFSFFQTNTLGAEKLYSKVLEYIGDFGDDKIVFDLYSGTGTITQLVSKRAKLVYGVEIVEEAVNAAVENAKLNSLENCKFYAGDVLTCIDNIGNKPDFIILDPPREGIHPKAIDKIIDFGVDNIIYISCKPTSLKDDLKVFYDKGYRVEKCCLVDMFPMTVHVETVVLMSRKDK